MKTSKGLKAFCENVKRLREDSNLTKEEMAEIMKISVPDLNKIEEGIVPLRLSASVLANLATHFKISATSLLR